MKKYLLLTIIVLLAACKQATVPTEYAKSDQLPEIYPDYIDVTVPVNIAPLTFELLPSPAKKASFTQMVARYSFDGDDQLAELNSAIKEITDENRTLRGRISAMKKSSSKGVG